MLAFNASPLNSLSFNFLLWRRHFQQCQWIFATWSWSKLEKKENRGSVYCDPLTCGSLNLSTIFCRFLIDIVPSRRTYWYLGKEKKIHIVWRLVCNYSLEYLFLFVLCTLLVLIIDVYNKQTNKQKTTTKKAKTTVIWLCFVSTKLRFVTFVFSTFLLSLFFPQFFSILQFDFEHS